MIKLIIYKITNLKNNKSYIGKTTRDLETRLGEHLRHQDKPIGQALAEYGLDSFAIDVIDTAETNEELNSKERYWIAAYDSMIPNGYNQSYGGDTSEGFRHRKESKRKMSKAKSSVYSGEGNPFYGKRHTEEARKKMSEAWKTREYTDEWRQHLSESHKKQAVINVDTGEVFPSIKSAAEKYCIKATHITRVCKGKRKRTGGFRWAYFDNECDE